MSEAVSDLVVPVKSLVRAKSRLELPARHPAEREALALAMASDTIAAACGSSTVGGVFVLTADPLVTQVAQRHGANVLREQDVTDLNTSLGEALRRLGPGRRVGVLLGDLPALGSDAVDDVLSRAGSDPVVCADRRGTGSTLVVPGGPQHLTPLFGPDSLAAHRAAGFREVRPAPAGLRHDVDTYSDLVRAWRLGVGPATTAWLERARRCGDRERFRDLRPRRSGPSARLARTGVDALTSPRQRLPTTGVGGRR